MLVAFSFNSFRSLLAFSSSSFLHHPLLLRFLFFVSPRKIEPVNTILNDTRAAQFVDGISYHWYGANLHNYQFLAQVHAAHPTIPMLATEATLEAPFQQVHPWQQASMYAVDIIGDLNQHTIGWMEWNVLLDKSGGPTCIGPEISSVCVPLLGICDAPLLADTSKQTLEIRDSFWFMAHFSRYLPRGSVVVETFNQTATVLQMTAAVTPANKLVLVVLNTATEPITYQIQVGPSYYAATAPAEGIQTFVGQLPPVASS